MKKVLPIVIIVVLVGMGGFLVFSNGDDSAPSSSSSSASQSSDSSPVESNVVDIQNFAFNSPAITVKVGTTVTWTNQDSTAHTVTPDNKGDFEGSSLLNKGQSYSVTFNEVGTFAYHCTPHPHMKGTVVVTN